MCIYSTFAYLFLVLNSKNSFCYEYSILVKKSPCWSLSRIFQQNDSCERSIFKVLADLNGCWLSVVRFFVVFQIMCKLFFIKYLLRPVTMKIDVWEAYYKRIPNFKSPLFHLMYFGSLNQTRRCYILKWNSLTPLEWSRTQAQGGIS